MEKITICEILYGNYDTILALVTTSKAMVHAYRQDKEGFEVDEYMERIATILNL